MSTENPTSTTLKATLLLASTLTVMSGATISPALPAIRAHFAGTPNAALLVGLVLTVPGLFIAVTAPIAGVVADRSGRKPLLIAATVLYAFAGGAGFVLDSLVAIIASRAFLGIAVGGITVGATALITDYYTGDQRDTVLGLQGTFLSFGGVVFPLLGGVLADVGWRVPFLIYLSSLVLLPLMLRSLYEPTTTESAGSIPHDLASLRRTLREIPVRLLALIYGIILFGQIVFYMIPVQAPFYIQDLTGATGTLVGLAIAVASMTGGILASQYHPIRARLGVVRVVAVVFALMGIGYVIVGTSATYLGILAGLAVAGAGLGLLIPKLNAWISAEIPDDFRGSALGGLTSFLFLGQFLSPIATQPISTRIGLGAAYAVVGVVLVVLALGFVGLSHRVRAPAPQERIQANQ